MVFPLSLTLSLGEGTIIPPHPLSLAFRLSLALPLGEGIFNQTPLLIPLYPHPSHLVEGG